MSTKVSLKHPTIGVRSNHVVIASDTEDGERWHTLEMDPTSARLYAQQVLAAAALIDGEPATRRVKVVKQEGTTLEWVWE